VCDLRAGDTCIHDLKRDPVSFLEKPHHELFFYLPRAALNAIADNASAPRIGDLDCRLAAAVNDATIAGLGGTILPALSHPQQANRLFVDHVSLAVGVHVASTYGGMRPVSRPVGAGSPHGRSAAPRKFSVPISMVVCRSKTWRGNVAYR
jgi:AraC family transcriptional regulator